MRAFADEAGAAAAEHGPLLQDPRFWVAVAFVIFVAATARPIMRAVGGGLDKHADQLRRQLDEARDLRDEAQHFLADSKRRQRDAAEEAEEILKAARAEAERMRVHAAEEMEHAMARRRELALQRIAQAESEAKKEIRDRAVDIAISAAAKTLEAQLQGPAGDALTEAAIKELSQKLN